MARSVEAKELFTASEVARFCQVDLKTIHNWADRGEIRHFRTPGRHLRFRRADVLDFLRRYGYPVPDGLAGGPPRVVVLSTAVEAEGGPHGNDDLQAALGDDVALEQANGRDAVAQLLRVGADPPDAVVVMPAASGLPLGPLVTALSSDAATRHVRTLVWMPNAAGMRDALLDQGAAAVVERGHGDELRSAIAAVLGLDRG